MRQPIIQIASSIQQHKVSDINFFESAKQLREYKNNACSKDAEKGHMAEVSARVTMLFKKNEAFQLSSFLA